MHLITPNLIIAGAPKCGTTSLFEYLAAHPQVCAANIHETRYLIDPGYPLYRESCNYQRSGIEGYAQFFNDCKSRAKDIIVEATPDYIYQKTPLQVLPDFDQVPSVIFLLRKPSERVYSMYQFAKNNMGVLDAGISFFQFLDMIENKHPFLTKRAILENLVEHGKYVHYISKWREVLGADKIKILLFEDMVSDPCSFMKKFALNYGVDADFYQGYEFTPKNETLVLRNKMIHQFKRRTAALLPQGKWRGGLGKLYKRINARNSLQRKTAEDLDVLAKLDKMYAPFNDKLERLTRVGLEKWK